MASLAFALKSVMSTAKFPSEFLPSTKSSQRGEGYRHLGAHALIVRCPVGSCTQHVVELVSTFGLAAVGLCTRAISAEDYFCASFHASYAHANSRFELFQ